jgi:hypothetical protein
VLALVRCFDGRARTRVEELVGGDAVVSCDGEPKTRCFFPTFGLVSP